MNDMKSMLVASLCVVSLACGMLRAAEPADTRLLAHWPLAGDARDTSGNNLHARVLGTVDFSASGPNGKPRTAAAFNGRDAYLEVAGAKELQLGKHDFTITAWVSSPDKTDDVPGDILSFYDAATRRGVQLSLKTSAGVTTNLANDRQLQFGIDSDRHSEWIDRGRPGNALLAFALAAHDGELFVGTCEPGQGESGRVYRFGGGKDTDNKWIDCGAPTAANSVTAMAEFEGGLYVGTGKYRLGGSALEESKNANLGGRVLRYQGDSRWLDCGQLPGVEAVGGLVVFRGRLYASSLYKPAGFFRYEGGEKWTDCGVPGRRVEAMAVYNGHLYASSYDGGVVFRYDGQSWQECGQVGPAENTQTYSFAVYGGRLYVGTWRTGRVYRFEESGKWTDVGRLGEELEVMGMLVHNGRLIAGTLPLAEVYAFDGRSAWTKLARLDHTPEVTYRRAWTMAEFGGQVFCSTLPSGRIYSWQAGRVASADRAFPTGWQHVAAVRTSGKLQLWINGRQAAASEPFDDELFDLSSGAPWRLGLGSSDFFLGSLSDVQVYRGALDEKQIAGLAAGKK